MGNKSSAQSSSPSLPIDSTFNLPSPLPSWPSGEGFAKGRIDLGGLEVCQVETFNKVWTVYEGGQDNLGATFFEPSSVPQGFSILGFYAQPNNRKLFGWTLVGKDLSGESLRPPVDYLLLWSGKSTKVQNNRVETGYFWQPVPPDGYNAVGLVVTTSAEKPPLDKIRCVRSDLTDQSVSDALIWEIDGFSVSSSKPVNRGTQASGVCVVTFFSNSPNSTLPCLENNKFDFSSMPSKPQIDALFQAYAPWIYFHEDEKYLPASVNWFFSNGALLYKKGDESNPVPVEPNGLNLPQGEANDGLYWLDLPVFSEARKRVQGGDLQSMEVYMHIKPVFGGTFTDIAVWMFYPFNGPSRAKLKAITIPLGKIGEHIGDWEHFTLRISNFSGKLQRMYLSQHSRGSWIDASDIEFQDKGNKPVAYASLNGHAMYSKPGLVLQGKDGVGIRNDTGKSEKVIDTAVRFRVVAAEYMRGGEVEEPAWLNYLRHWGPKIDYGHEDEIRGVEKIMVGESLKNVFRSAIKGLPNGKKAVKSRFSEKKPSRKKKKGRKEKAPPPLCPSRSRRGSGASSLTSHRSVLLSSSPSFEAWFRLIWCPTSNGQKTQFFTAVGLRRSFSSRRFFHGELILHSGLICN